MGNVNFYKWKAMLFAVLQNKCYCSVTHLENDRVVLLLFLFRHDTYC